MKWGTLSRTIFSGVGKIRYKAREGVFYIKDMIAEDHVFSLCGYVDKLIALWICGYVESVLRGGQCMSKADGASDLIR